MEASAAIYGLAIASPAREERLANLKQRAVDMLARTKGGSSSKVRPRRDDSRGERAGFEDESYGHGTCDDSGASTSSPSFGEVSTSSGSYGISDRSTLLSTSVAREGRHSGQHSPPSPPSLQRIPLAIAQSPSDRVFEKGSNGQGECRLEGKMLGLLDPDSLSPKPVPTTPTRQQQSVSCLASAVEAIQLTKSALATHYPSPRSDRSSVDSPTGTGSSSARSVESPTMPQETSRSRRPLPACLRQWDEDANSEDNDGAAPEQSKVYIESVASVGTATLVIEGGTDEQMKHRTESHADDPLLQLRALLAKQRSHSSSLDHRRLYLGRRNSPIVPLSRVVTNFGGLTDACSEALPDTAKNNCFPIGNGESSAAETGIDTLEANDAEPLLNNKKKSSNAFQSENRSLEGEVTSSSSRTVASKPTSAAVIRDDSRAVMAANRIIELVRSVQPSAAAAEVARKRAAAARAETALNVSADGGAALAQQWGACALADAKAIAKKRVPANSSSATTATEAPRVAAMAVYHDEYSPASVALTADIADVEGSETADDRRKTRAGEVPLSSTTAHSDISAVTTEEAPAVVESATKHLADTEYTLPFDSPEVSSTSWVARGAGPSSTPAGLSMAVNTAEAPNLGAENLQCKSTPRSRVATAPSVSAAAAAAAVGNGEDVAGDVAWARAAPGAVARSAARIAAAEARAEKAEARAEAAERALSCGQRDMEWRVRRAAEAAAEAAAKAAEVAVADAKRQAAVAIKEAQDQTVTAQARVAVAEAEAAATALAVEALAVRDKEQASALEKSEARAASAEARANQAHALLHRHTPAGATVVSEKQQGHTETVERGSQTSIESTEATQVSPVSSSTHAKSAEATEGHDASTLAATSIPLVCPECSCASSNRGWPSMSQGNGSNDFNDSRSRSHRSRKHRKQRGDHRKSLSLGGNGDSSLELLDALLAPPPQNVILEPITCSSYGEHSRNLHMLDTAMSDFTSPPIDATSKFVGASLPNGTIRSAQQSMSEVESALTNDVVVVGARDMLMARGRVVAAHAAAAAKWANSKAQIDAGKEEAARLRIEVQHWRAALEHAERTAQAAQTKVSEVIAGREADATDTEERHERAVRDLSSALTQERSARSTLENRVVSLTASRSALEADVARLQAWQRSRLARLDRAVDHSLTRRRRRHRGSSRDRDGKREDEDGGRIHEESAMSPSYMPHLSGASSRASKSSQSPSRACSLNGSSSSDEATHYSSCSDTSVSFHSLSSSSRLRGLNSEQRNRRQVTFDASQESCKGGDDEDDDVCKVLGQANTRSRPRNRRARWNHLSGHSSSCTSGNSTNEGDDDEQETADDDQVEEEDDSSGSTDLLRKLTATLDRSYEFRRVASPSPDGRWARSVPVSDLPGAEGYS